MLTFLGVVTIATLLGLVLFRLTSVLAALILVPLAVGLLGGLGSSVGTHALSGIQGVAGTATMLGFAVLYFGVMRAAGLFSPVIRSIVGVCGSDPRRLVVGTALVAMLIHLDGSGASTFLIAVPALLPVYERMGLDRAVLACTVALAAGTMNILPWGGPTLRAAASLQVDVSALFQPLLPSVVVGLGGVLVVSVWLGHGERRRLATLAAETGTAPVQGTASEATDERPDAPRLLRFNTCLTMATLVALVLELLPLPLVFMTAFAIALVVNHPDPQAQRAQLEGHGSHAMLMVALILAAGVFAGILRESGMLAAMGESLVASLPPAMVAHLPVLTAVTAMPLSLA